jgi:hypothetical protein
VQPATSRNVPSRNRRVRRVVAVALTALAFTATTVVPAQARTDIVPGGDGTTGSCHRWVQVWYNGPWVCLF